jgi:hypothetical protein
MIPSTILLTEAEASTSLEPPPQAVKRVAPIRRVAINLFFMIKILSFVKVVQVQNSI